MLYFHTSDQKKSQVYISYAYFILTIPEPATNGYKLVHTKPGK